MSDTIVELRQLSEEEQKHAEAYYREKRQHDEASALGQAWREGFILSYAESVAAERNAMIEEMLKMVLLKRTSIRSRQLLKNTIQYLRVKHMPTLNSNRNCLKNIVHGCG